MKVSFLIGFDGKLKARFNSPDKIYQKYSLSNFFSINTAQIDSNMFVTNQFFSNKLKYWTYEGKKVKEVNLNLGKTYRKINDNAFRYFENRNMSKFNNNISRKNQLLYDNCFHRSLVCYYNDFYPKGVINPFSPKIKTNKYIVISNDNGESLTNKPIQVHKSFIPFYFHDNIIFASELDSDRHLEIVKYKFVED